MIISIMKKKRSKKKITFEYYILIFSKLLKIELYLPEMRIYILALRKKKENKF